MYIDPTNIFPSNIYRESSEINARHKHQAVIVTDDRGVNVFSATGRLDGEHCLKKIL